MNALVKRLIAANEGNEQAASGDIYYLAAERIVFLERDQAEMRALINECCEYLAINEYTNIGHGSILHNKMIEIK